MERRISDSIFVVGRAEDDKREGRTLAPAEEVFSTRARHWSRLWEMEAVEQIWPTAWGERTVSLGFKWRESNAEG